MKFARPEKQARDAKKQVTAHGKSRAETRGKPLIPGFRSGEHFEKSMKDFVGWLQDQPEKACIDTFTTDQARQYLELRAQFIDQGQLDKDRYALKVWIEHRDGIKNAFRWRDYKDKGQDNSRLAKESRYYTPEQMRMVQAHQQPHNAFATKVAYEAGLRAKELYTIAKPHEQPADERPWRPDKNVGQPDHRYTVIGKGGLIREIRLSPETARQLEATRRETPATITDRGVHYTSRYAIGGGNAWSSSFTRASERALRWTAGAHSTRHSYVQERMEQLQQRGYNWQDAREVVSQEVGHFSTQHTDEYLR